MEKERLTVNMLEASRPCSPTNVPASSMHAGCFFSVTTHSEYVQMKYTHSELVFSASQISKTHIGEHSSEAIRRTAARD